MDNQEVGLYIGDKKLVIKEEYKQEVIDAIEAEIETSNYEFYKDGLNKAIEIINNK